MEEQISGVIHFLEAFEGLKDISRKGWKVKAGISLPESVADHTLLVVVLCVVFADLKRASPEKMVRMALLHDLAETILGDAIPEEIPNPEERREQEFKVIEEVLAKVPNEIRSNWLEALQELFSRRTDESKLVWELDKLEMAFQAKLYRNRAGNPRALSEFIASASKAIQSPDIVYLLEKIRSDA